MRKTKLFFNDFFQKRQPKNKTRKIRIFEPTQVIEIQQPTTKDDGQCRNIKKYKATEETKEVHQMSKNICNVKNLTPKLDEITQVEI